MLYEQIKRASLEARKAKDSVTANVLGLLLADIQNRAKDAKRDPALPESEDISEAALKRAKKMNDQAQAVASTPQLVAERIVLDSFMVRLVQATSDEEIMEVVNKLILENPEKAIPQGAGWFMGQVMKAFKGQANPATVKPLIDKALAK